MPKLGLKTLGTIVVLVAGLIAGSGQTAVAQDKVKVGVFPTASSLPYFVAIERGFFKEQNIEPETIRLIGGPPNIAAMISNQIEAAVVLVTIEAMNANLKKPGVAMYIGVHSQSKIYQMEQFVARTGYAAATLKDLKGARIMSAPGPANLVAAEGKKGIDFVNQNPQEARKYLAKNTLTPEDVVDTVPMVRYFMAGELTDKHKAEFQKFIDFSTAVGTLPEKVDITKYLQAY